MATVHSLEKLSRMLKSIEGDESLESAVASERLNSLLLRTQQILRQRSFLREERRRIRMSAERIEELKTCLLQIRKPSFLAGRVNLASSEDVVGTTISSRLIKINVGGLIFEVAQEILRRDPTSLLATLSLSAPETSLVLPEDGIFYFDRDWWLFRYILRFLRDGFLPDDRKALGQLYKEAGFWHLMELRKAIENEKLHLRMDDNKEPLPAPVEASSIWWKAHPTWWFDNLKESKYVASQIASIAVAQSSKPDFPTKESETAKNEVEDWWTGTTYRGKTFNVSIVK